MQYNTTYWKSLPNKDCRKFGRKNYGEFKFICIGDVMEIVKIGKKTWKIAVIHQMRCNSLLPMFLLYDVTKIVGIATVSTRMA